MDTPNGRTSAIHTHLDRRGVFSWAWAMSGGFFLLLESVIQYILTERCIRGEKDTRDRIHGNSAIRLELSLLSRMMRRRIKYCIPRTKDGHGRNINSVIEWLLWMILRRCLPTRVANSWLLRMRGIRRVSASLSKSTFQDCMIGN